MGARRTRGPSSGARGRDGAAPARARWGRRLVSTVPEAMTAVEIAHPGGPEVLRPVSRPTPAPGPREVLIAVAAAGVNRPDVLQRQGQYAPPPGASDIPGLEVAGRV